MLLSLADGTLAELSLHALGGDQLERIELTRVGSSAIATCLHWISGRCALLQ